MNIFTKIDVITKHQTNNPYKTFLYVFSFDEFTRTNVSNSERLFIQKCLNKNSPKQGKISPNILYRPCNHMEKQTKDLHLPYNEILMPLSNQ